MGTANMMGITEEDWHACWNEVHKANMRKETYPNKADTENIKLGVRKPRGWVAPDFSSVLGAE
jgi:predicted HAD superfamily Cof-like phosphohydrolase